MLRTLPQQGQGLSLCHSGIFSDAVPHTKTDGFFAHYWSNTLTGRRYLIVPAEIGPVQVRVPRALRIDDCRSDYLLELQRFSE
eukprot:1886784-Pyramimonas_sp.AAC.1